MTHGLTFLPQCDLIVVLDEGRIREMGTYSELMNNKGAFSEFLQTYATTGEEGEGIVYWGGGWYWGGGRSCSVLIQSHKPI